ncbi:sigma-70 family RNA polymerase sigma factor [Bacillus sp. 1P06AnD]|uniref:sigma-70 family RNA polymerase sigma factor n=1 Tax=Bacillus sp. 1P06AnD TaxID=3132208 RepID=UPI0039A2BFDC
MNEDELRQSINSVLSGKADAFSILYDGTINQLYKNVVYLMEERQAVDDIIQEIYIEAFKSLKKYDPSRSFFAWLMGIAIRQIHNYKRKKWRIFSIEKKAKYLRNEHTGDFSGDIVNQMTNQKIRDLVDELPYKLKQVVILRYMNNFTVEQTARILEIPIGTVKSRNHAAIRKLSQQQDTLNLLCEGGI